MKYSEFKELVEGLDYSKFKEYLRLCVIEKDDWWEVWIDNSNGGWTIGTVSKNKIFDFTIDNPEGFGGDDQTMLKNYAEVYKAIFDLAMTPIEDREDEKYYTVELPFLYNEVEKLFLNGFYYSPFWSANFSNRFTEKEIKEIDPRLWEFAVEVED